jgi:2,4-dienoyl-CoA reductase-like NADH-dependent reductase (Old Yellow Enzyme family)
MITEPRQAEEILQNGGADAVLIARESLRNPYFPFLAAQELGGSVEAPKQYGRAIIIEKAQSA